MARDRCQYCCGRKKQWQSLSQGEGLCGIALYNLWIDFFCFYSDKLYFNVPYKNMYNQPMNSVISHLWELIKLHFKTDALNYKAVHGFKGRRKEVLHA